MTFENNKEMTFSSVVKMRIHGDLYYITYEGNETSYETIEEVTAFLKEIDQDGGDHE